jgi:hypothetical protein
MLGYHHSYPFNILSEVLLFFFKKKKQTRSVHSQTNCLYTYLKKKEKKIEIQKHIHTREEW